MTVSIAPHNTQAPLKGLRVDEKMHKVAEGFVGTFFTQMVDTMFSDANDSDGDGLESEMYGSFLAEAMAKKIATSKSSDYMVRNIENMLRRQGGLEEIKGSPSVALNSYKKIGGL